MVKVLFDEDNVLSLDAVAKRLADDRHWKSYTVDAKEGIIHATTLNDRDFHIDLGGFAYDDETEETIDEFEVDWPVELFNDTWKSVMFAKNEDGEYVIVHD